MATQESTPEADKLAPLVRQTLDAIAELHEQHRSSASLWERGFEWTAATLAKPPFLIGLTALTFGWICLNSVLADSAPDRSPFPLLATGLALLAVYISLAIIAAQRRASALADLRAQLTLQHAILAENKSAKIIQLLEELRKDDPAIVNRRDALAEAMAAPTNPSAVAVAMAEKNEAQAD